MLGTLGQIESGANALLLMPSLTYFVPSLSCDTALLGQHMQLSRVCAGGVGDEEGGSGSQVDMVCPASRRHHRLQPGMHAADQAPDMCM